jgi:hypothetical protein
MINEFLSELSQLTRIEVLEKDDKSAKVRFLDYVKTDLTDYDYEVVRFFDYYLLEAIKLNKQFDYKIKSVDGLKSLANDLREVANNQRFLFDGYEIIESNLVNGLYDLDPYFQNHKGIYQILHQRIFGE